jgi:hypothetical protein
MVDQIKPVIIIGIIALLVAIATVLVFNTFYNTRFFKMPMNVIILLLIPYALSVTGMVLYTQAKENGNNTVTGLVCNLIALIISNLLIINAIILFFTKKLGREK